MAKSLRQIVEAKKKSYKYGEPTWSSSSGAPVWPASETSPEYYDADDWDDEKKEKSSSKNKKKIKEETLNETDTVELTIPLFIRMLEFAKEDAKTDMDLHKATENLMDIDGVADMTDYENIVDV